MTRQRSTQGCMPTCHHENLSCQLKSWRSGKEVQNGLVREAP
jgi:hypothetical protein